LCAEDENTPKRVFANPPFPPFAVIGQFRLRRIADTSSDWPAL
jgi:hypothetical protein